jgi:hypothetical protein
VSTSLSTIPNYTFDCVKPPQIQMGSQHLPPLTAAKQRLLTGRGIAMHACLIEGPRRQGHIYMSPYSSLAGPTAKARAHGHVYLARCRNHSQGMMVVPVRLGVAFARNPWSPQRTTLRDIFFRWVYICINMEALSKPVLVGSHYPREINL